MLRIEEALEELKLSLSESSKNALENFFKKLLELDFDQWQFKNISNRIQKLCLFFLASLTKQAPEFENFHLSDLFERLSGNEDPQEKIQATLSYSREILSKLNLPLEEIKALMLDYGHYRLIFLSLCTLCQKFFLKEDKKEKIWTVFLSLSSSRDNPQIAFMIEIIAALIFLVQQSEGLNKDFDYFIDIFERNTNYHVDQPDLESHCKEILEKYPLYNSSESILEYVQRQYISTLRPHSVNYLCFLHSGRSALSSPIPSTPLRILSHPGNVISKAQNLRRNLAFSRLPISKESDQIHILSSPEKQLLSPLIKKEICSLDYIKNHSEMFQWIKTFVRDVELVKIELESGMEVLISSYFKDFLKIKHIRLKFKEISNLLEQFNLSDNDQFSKFYFKILELLIENELKERRENVRIILNDSSFIVALFAFCYELRFFVQLPCSSRKLLEFSRKNLHNLFDFYKVLISFVQILYKQLPKLIKAHIYRLEYAILLEELWTRPLPGLDFFPKRLYLQPETLFSTILNKIRNFMAERLYLVTHSLGFSDELKDNIWETFDLLLAAGMGRSDPEELFSFKFDIHLDTLLLSTILEWREALQMDFSQAKLFLIYSDKVLFPVNSINENVTQFSLNHRLIVQAILKIVKDPAINKRAELNSTPILSNNQLKQRKSLNALSISENLNFKLEKRPFNHFSGDLNVEKCQPQILSQYTNVRNTFNLGFKKIKSENFNCLLPTSESLDIVELSNEPKTPNFSG